MSTYFLLDPFEFPYYFYRIRGGGMIYVLSYPVEETYNAPFGYKFNSSAFKKTFMPNNTITENSH